MVASDSRISKATRVVMLASFSLMTMIMMEIAVADPIVTQQVFQVEHVKIESTKKFAEVEAALDAAIPQLDPAIGAALTNGEEKRAKELQRGAELFIFLNAITARCCKSRAGHERRCNTKSAIRLLQRG
jgi:hypothetical protein